MDERLATNGATDVAWVSKKTVEGVWLVSAEYKIDSQPAIATWSFDPKGLSLVPENQSALLLSNGSPLSLIESKPVKTEQILHPTVTASQVETVIEEFPTQTTGLSVVPELIEETQSEEDNRTEVINIVETETRATFHVVDDVVEEVETYEQEEQSFVEEIVEEVVEEVVEEESFDSFSEEEVSQEEPVAEPVVEVEEKPTTQTPPIQSTSRWAEVLFGSKDEEEN
jgi:hypothetical protein